MGAMTWVYSLAYDTYNEYILMYSKSGFHGNIMIITSSSESWPRLKLARSLLLLMDHINNFPENNKLSL